MGLIVSRETAYLTRRGIQLWLLVFEVYGSGGPHQQTAQPIDIIG